MTVFAVVLRKDERRMDLDARKRHRRISVTVIKERPDVRDGEGNGAVYYGYRRNVSSPYKPAQLMRQFT